MDIIIVIGPSSHKTCNTSDPDGPYCSRLMPYARCSLFNVNLSVRHDGTTLRCVECKDAEKLRIDIYGK